MAHRIAVLSDTHSLLRPEIRERLRSCEMILHAGDISSQETAEEIQECGQTYFVRGNADKGTWAEAIPKARELQLYGLEIYMIHNRRQISAELSGKDIVIYGHSHKYSEAVQGGVCFFNPGSCGPRRLHQEITMALLNIEEDGRYSFEKILIPHAAGQPQVGGLADRDMAKLVSAIIRQMDAGKKVDEIAKRNRVDAGTVNQVLQIYTTHPGIDVQGILDRIEIAGR